MGKGNFNFLTYFRFFFIDKHYFLNKKFLQTKVLNESIFLKFLQYQECMIIHLNYKRVTIFN